MSIRRPARHVPSSPRTAARRPTVTIVVNLLCTAAARALTDTLLHPLLTAAVHFLTGTSPDA
ncbi:hypothetical protein [Kitasatospora sp. NPDC056800]|uniref:hypothetical protein n=1 Tax=Kitasatospora sp. NPDC056800 TaxID=3345948 RepID=UPI00367365EB